jgi:phosphatidylglycerophosphatase A
MRPTTILARTITSGFGTGFAPKASGTVASAACVVAWLLLQRSAWALSTVEIAFLAAGLSTLGLLATHALIHDPEWSKVASGNNGKAHLDPSEVVIDEWAGMLIALIPASPTLGEALIAFSHFRTFDIMKFGPIGRAERLPGAFGIMLDDIVAGVAAALILIGLQFAWRV